jgi:hypothetical protein
MAEVNEAFGVGSKYGVEQGNFLLSDNPGTTAPTNPFLWMKWLDVNNPSVPLLKHWNGSSWA